jgi:SagB-type dehydrogenase family enzyme
MISRPRVPAERTRYLVVAVFSTQMWLGMHALAADTIALPPPRLDGAMALERALAERRSVREYARGALTLDQIAQLLWAAQGVTGANGLRSAPSAGALYPLELYLVAGEVRGLAAGVYRYIPGKHRLAQLVAGDRRRQLCATARAQECVAEGAAVVVFSAVERRTTRKYGERGVRYVHIEVGHAAQNLALQAVALGLGSVTVGAFDDAAVTRLLNLPKGEAPLYLMPIGPR